MSDAFFCPSPFMKLIFPTLHYAKYCNSFSEAAAGKAEPVEMEDAEVRAGVVGA